MRLAVPNMPGPDLPPREAHLYPEKRSTTLVCH